MVRTLLRVAAWAAATSIGMAMSWFGVHSALSADAFDERPQAIPVSPPPPQIDPATSVPPPPTTSKPSPATSSSVPSPTSSAPPPQTSTGEVRPFQLTGGRVVLEMGATSARLVSATPEAGWQVQVWQAAEWIRVDFSRTGDNTHSCFVTWNGHPPTVQTT